MALLVVSAYVQGYSKPCIHAEKVIVEFLVPHFMQMLRTGQKLPTTKKKWHCAYNFLTLGMKFLKTVSKMPLKDVNNLA